jgi:hypothetical protein
MKTSKLGSTNNCIQLKKITLTRLLMETAGGVLSVRSTIGAAAGETFVKGPKELPSRGCKKKNALKKLSFEISIAN